MNQAGQADVSITEEFTPEFPNGFYSDWLSDEFIKKVEDSKNCKFVGEFPVRPHSTNVGALFYQETPPKEGFSNYFFLYINYKPTGVGDELEEELFITSGEHMDRRILSGIRTPSGRYTYSRGRHDCVALDNTIVDGGDSYLRTMGNAEVVYFQLVKDKLLLTKLRDPAIVNPERLEYVGLINNASDSNQLADSNVEQ